MEPVSPRRRGEAEISLFWRVALPFIAGYYVSYVYRMVNAVLAPTLAAEFGLSAGGLGLLSSMYFLSFGLFQLPLGILLDRFGPRRVNATLLLVAATGGAWFACADSAGAAIAARALVGLGVSASLMASLTAFVLWYPPERISTLNGYAFSAGMLGALTVTVPLEMLLRVWHWREAFLLIVAATVAVSLLLWLWVPERTARPSDQTLADQVRALRELFRDRAFRRLAVCVGTSQCAAVALQTLWIATWLRDVAGYSPAEIARALLALNFAMAFGYLGFGRAADAFQRRGRSPVLLLFAGVGLSSATLALVIAGVRGAPVALWCLFMMGATAVVLGYAIMSGRYSREMAGRTNTAINMVAFAGMFIGQWAVGLVLDQWPQTATGYAPEAYRWALGMLWAVQFAGLAWLWSGRKLFLS